MATRAVAPTAMESEKLMLDESSEYELILSTSPDHVFIK